MDLQELEARLARLEMGQKAEMELARFASALGRSVVDEQTRKSMFDWAAGHGCDVVLNELSNGPAIFTKRQPGATGR